MKQEMEGEPVWVEIGTMHRIHHHAIEVYGGTTGLRNPGLLEQAAFRPRHLHYYAQVGDIPRLAASYLAAIVQNHPFVDGNQRTGWITAMVFVDHNGWELRCDPESAYEVVRNFASNRNDETDLIVFMERHAHPI